MRFLNPIAPVKVVFAVVLLLLAFYLFTQGSMFGLVLIAAAARLSMRLGAEVDVFEKRYRKLTSIFAITWGEWRKLPEIEYVSIFKTIKKSRARVIAAQALVGTEVYRLNLFYQTNKHITVYEGETHAEAQVKAQGIAKALEVEIYDPSQQP